MGLLNRGDCEIWAGRDCTWLGWLNGGRWAAEAEVAHIAACVVRLVVDTGFGVGIEAHKLSMG